MVSTPLRTVTRPASWGIGRSGRIGGLLVTLWLSLLWSPGILGYFVSISDQTQPLLKTPDGHSLMNWAHGDLLQMMRSSRGVRINERGVQFVRFGTVRGIAWEGIPCLPDPTSLCRTPEGSRFFPLDHAYVSANVSQVQGGMRGIASVGCTGERSGRTIREPSTVYDVSLCDIVDSRLDVYWDGDMVRHRRMSMSVWLYVAISIVTVYLVSCIAQNLTSLLVGVQAAAETESLWVWLVRLVEVAVVSTVLGLSTLPMLWNDSLLLVDELSYLAFMLLYVSVHFAVMCYKVWFDRENRRRHFLTFNLITGVLLLLTLAIYKTMANPYVGILLVMLTMRCFYKLLDMHLMDWDMVRLGYIGLYLESLLMLLDVFAMLFTHYVGFRRGFMFGFDGDVSFVIVCLFSWFVSRFVIKES